MVNELDPLMYYHIVHLRKTIKIVFMRHEVLGELKMIKAVSLDKRKRISDELKLDDPNWQEVLKLNDSNVKNYAMSIENYIEELFDYEKN